MSLSFYNIYFGKDGHIYFNKENRKEFIREDDFKKLFYNFTSDDETQNLRFWTSALHNNVFFQEGITVWGVWNCLKESSVFWSNLLGIDVKSYLSELEKPTKDDTYMEKYDSIISFNLPALSLDSYNGANFYHIRMTYNIKGFNKKKGIFLNDRLAEIPLNLIKKLPFYFERIDGVFLEEDIKPSYALDTSLFKNYYREATLYDAVFATFGHSFKSPEQRDSRQVPKVDLDSVNKQRNDYLNNIETLKQKGVIVNLNLQPLSLPDTLSKACSTVLPYALKKCK